jgi:hypothetical protein
MLIDMRTKRRWILSVLEAVSESTETRPAERMTVQQPAANRMVNGQKGFALRLKAATRPLAEAAR